MVAPWLHSGSTCWIYDYSVSSPPRESDMAKVTSALDEILGVELTGAQTSMGSSVEAILLAALGRTVARTVGDGVLDVEIGGAAARRASVSCGSRRSLCGHDLLATVSVVADRAGHRHDGGAHVHFRYDSRRGSVAHTGHPLALDVYRDSATMLRLDWRYDTRGFDHATVSELAEQFPLALIEVTSG